MLQNKSGQLDQDEFINLYSSLRYEPPDSLQKIAEFMFKAFDTDKNGNLFIWKFDGKKSPF